MSSTPDSEIRWSGNVRAQKQADAAFHQFWVKATRKRKTKQQSEADKKKQRLKDWEAAERQRQGDMPYTQYLTTKHWKRKRAQALKHYGNECSVCKSKYNLHVHHKNYLRLFKEKLTDLEVRCAGCHANEHEGNKPGCYDPMTERFLELASAF